MSYEVETETTEFEVTSQRIAELIVQGLGGHDILIFGDQIEGRRIDTTTGEIL